MLPLSLSFIIAGFSVALGVLIVRLRSPEIEFETTDFVDY